jgi:hypothetical protein
MKKPFLLIVVSLLLSCDRYPDPVMKLLENYSFSFQNVQGSKYEIGETVDVLFRAFNNNEMEESLKVDFELLSGDGALSQLTEYTDENGMTMTKWTLGSGAGEQKLRASTYDASGKFLTSSELYVYALADNEWNTLNNSPDGDIIDIATDTINSVTIMITYNMLFRQGTNYYEWTEINEPDINSPRTIDVDRNGIFYVSNYNGSMFKSIDHGYSWLACTKPFAEVWDIVKINITSDNYVWAYTWDHTVRYSKDGGNTWQDVGSGMTQGFGDIFRLNDGSLLYHGSDCCSLYRSFDETQTWEKIETPGFSIKLFIDKNEMITVCTQENGITLYNSIDFGLTFTKAHNVYPQYGTGMDNSFTKWKNTYYVLIPGYGILKSPDLIHYEDYWIKPAVRNLFIDHNGVLIAREMNNYTVHYRRNTTP